ncbi:hypothetical protein FHR84_000643 [Actinopolyspora biskrensis]|uniref:Uncharacterized protein n=1 Tax=Actinopolyspora biskrensis TaxID=1470178 RepID=A0A852YUT6_9ACTN|nr:hypothetical protein [Actinopolyspora biskrensis]
MRERVFPHLEVDSWSHFTLDVADPLIRAARDRGTRAVTMACCAS